MENEFRRIIEKAKIILADAPCFANDHDKVAMLNRKFRFDKIDAKNVLKILKDLRL